MLSALDETLHHQTPLVFDHVASTDHRFYDRSLMGGFVPDGEFGFLAGITAFPNMNVLEGFVMVQARSRRQYNVRLTRALRPRFDAQPAIGPLSLDIVAPFKELRYRLEPGDYPVALDITYRSVLPPHLEKPHFSRLDGRVDSDYMRYHQLGGLSGWIEVEGERIDATDWYGWRDHSWGVRPAVGGFEPMTGTKTAGGVSAASRTGGKGLFVFYLGFWNGVQGGSIQVIEDGEGRRIYTDGEVHDAAAPDGSRGPAIHVRTIDHKVTFKPGTRVFETLEATLGLENGETWEVKATSVGRPWVYRGGGYDEGFFDGKSQGVYRSGPLLIETDQYDLTHPEKIGFPDGSVGYTKHREQLAICEINGVTGSSYSPLFVIGDQPRFGLPNR